MKDSTKGNKFIYQPPPPPPPAPIYANSSRLRGGDMGYNKTHFVSQYQPSNLIFNRTSSTYSQQSLGLGSSYGKYGGSGGGQDKWKRPKKQNKLKGIEYEFLKTIKYKSNCNTLKDLYDKIEKLVWNREYYYSEG